MLRTQISLTAEERTTLDAEAARTGKSVSALIREAVELVYGVSRPTAGDLEIIQRAFGSWTDRDDDGAAFVEKIRSAARISEIDV